MFKYVYRFKKKIFFTLIIKIKNKGKIRRSFAVNKEDDEDILEKKDIIENGWEVCRKLGGGGFGQVYEIRKGNRNFAIKVEGIKGDEEHKPCLKREYDILKRIERKYNEYLRGDIFFPIPMEFNHFCKIEGHSFELDDDDFGNWKDGGLSVDSNKFICYYYIIMTLVGRNLSDLRRNEPEQRFGAYTISHLALETFKAIKTLHAIGFVHRDIKSSNFAVGGSNNQEIYLIDFGLAYTYGKLSKVLRGKRMISSYPPHPDYTDPDRRKGAGFRGTVRYASLRAHREEYLTYQDDLISWFYMLIEMSTGALPWKKVKNKKDVELIKERYLNINSLLRFRLHDERGQLEEWHNTYEVPEKLKVPFQRIYKRIMNINLGDPIGMEQFSSHSQNHYAEIESLLTKLKSSIMNMKNVHKKLDWDSNLNKQDFEFNSIRSIGAVIEGNGCSRFTPFMLSSEIIEESKGENSKNPKKIFPKVLSSYQKLTIRKLKPFRSPEKK